MALERTAFGKPMRKHFHFNPGYRPMNHGSFGAYPAYVQQEHYRQRAALEQRPDTYIRYGFPRALDESRRAVASLLHASDVDSVVFVPNATTGYNTVLRSIQWAAGDHIVYYDAAYGSLVKTIKYLEETTAVRGHCLEGVKFPMADDELLAVFERDIKALNARPGCRVRLAVFDTVSSMPGVRVPFERLVRRCRELGVLSFVDGAHGVGMIPLDLDALYPDFFVTNLHKWLHVPRGFAAMYVAPRNQSLIRSSLPTSHAFRPLDIPYKQFLPSQAPPFVELFEFVGTLDTQHYLTAPAAMEWRRRVCGGEEVVMEYVNRLAREGGDLVARMLGTEVMDCAGANVRDCAFANIRLPIEMGEAEGQVRHEDMYALWEWFTHYSVVEYDTYFQVLPYHGTWWIRLSGQVYLGMDDFAWTGNRLQEICAKIRLGRAEYVNNGQCKLCVESLEKSKL